MQSSGASPRSGFMTRKEGLARSVKLAQELGCTYDRDQVEDTIDCLRNKKPKELTDIEYFVDDYTLNFHPFVPTVDETFLPFSPQTLLKDGLIKDAPVLIGNNANEGYLSLLYLLPNMFPNNELKLTAREFTEEQYMKAVSNIYNFYPTSVSF